MDVRGYPTGPIDAKGALTSGIDLSPIIKPGPLNTAEADRPHIVDRPGMLQKYLPLRHEPATEAISIGGQHTTLWKRAFFLNTVRFTWSVTGAQDLGPITTHDLTRFERYSVPDIR
jgi:hypothetical protein